MDILSEHIVSARISAHEKPLIFAVDDDPVILNTINAFLGDSYKVIALTSGDNMLKAFEKHSPELFLLDIEMPGMNGYELIKQIRAREKFKNTPILIITGLSTREAVAAARTHGASGYMLKPLSKNTLLDKIHAHLTVSR